MRICFSILILIFVKETLAITKPTTIQNENATISLCYEALPSAYFNTETYDMDSFLMMIGRFKYDTIYSMEIKGEQLESISAKLVPLLEKTGKLYLYTPNLTYLPELSFFKEFDIFYSEYRVKNLKLLSPTFYSAKMTIRHVKLLEIEESVFIRNDCHIIFDLVSSDVELEIKYISVNASVIFQYMGKDSTSSVFSIKGDASCYLDKLEFISCMPVFSSQFSSIRNFYLSGVTPSYIYYLMNLKKMTIRNYYLKSTIALNNSITGRLIVEDILNNNPGSSVNIHK